MNCANHPDVPVSVFCQFCGKPLCKDCARIIHNVVGCEPCIAARLATPAAGQYTVNLGDKNFQYTATGPIPPPQPSGAPSPGMAFVLGWIPGVGAMYNGQFAKGLVHVLIFAILVSITDNSSGLFGLLVAGWVCYQVFDAYHTAIARRDGLPLPNPLGLNDIGQWFTGQRGNPFAPHPPTPAVPPVPGAPPAAPYAAPFTATSGFTSPTPPPPPMPPMPGVPPDQYDLPEIRNGVPTGAVVLIGVGILFLLGNLGVLSSHWLGHIWPLLLVALGAWILIRRSQSTPRGGPPSMPGNPPAGPTGGSL